MLHTKNKKTNKKIDRIGVLFLQSQSFFGADSAVHATLMRHFDRSRVRVHVACTTEGGSEGAVSAREQIEAIPDIAIRYTDFGDSISRNDTTKYNAKYLWAVLKQAGTLAKSLLALASYIRSQGITVIHATEKPRDCVFGLLLSHLTGARLVLHLHVRYAETLQPLVRFVIRQADAVIGVSEFVAQTIRDAGIPAERVFAVPNCLDIEIFEQGRKEPRHVVRREFDIPQDTLLFGIVSRLFRYKGHTDLLQALSLIRAELPCWHLMIVGADDPRSHPGGGSYRAELEVLIQELGLSSHVRFTGFRTDIASLMAACDVYTMPSFEEPLGMVYLEAMAMEKPIVAYASGGVPEIVPKSCGLLTPTGDRQALADAILLMAKDATLRERMGANGRHHVLTTLTPRQQCEQTLAVYSKVGQTRGKAIAQAGRTVSNNRFANDRQALPGNCLKDDLKCL